jgi:hypothetical protein
MSEGGLVPPSLSTWPIYATALAGCNRSILKLEGLFYARFHPDKPGTMVRRSLAVVSRNLAEKWETTAPLRFEEVFHRHPQSNFLPGPCFLRGVLVPQAAHTLDCS